MSDPEDPVRDRLKGSEDLYEVATWDERSWLDRLAVRVHGGLHTARKVALVLLALVLFVGLFGLTLDIVARQPILGVLGILSVLPALILVGYLWYGDPTTREPIEVLAATFILSILFATFAAIFNALFRPAFEPLSILGLVLYFFLIVGPIEEAVKWLSIRIYAYGQPSFQTVVDGVVYGAVAGLGFAAIENLFYILSAYELVADQGARIQFQYAVQTAIGRSFVGPGHVLFSAIAGYYLGLAKFNPGQRGPIVVKGLLIAAALHGLYNSIVSVVPFTPVAFIAFIVVFDGLLLLWILRKVSRYESYYKRVQTETYLTGSEDVATGRD